jgi:hypothetical protein
VTDDWTPFNPAARIRKRVDVIAPNAWVHPAYQLRRIEYRFADGESVECPLLAHPRGLRLHLDKQLYMLPWVTLF